MISKQDGLHARTPSELERRYNFGKSFSEIMGYATDAQKAAETAQSAASAAQGAADKANQALDDLDQEAIFNLLTNNGDVQGLFRAENGQIYINASYLASGIIDAAVVQVVNLIAERVQSIKGNSKIGIDAAKLEMQWNGTRTATIENKPLMADGAEVGISPWIAFFEYLNGEYSGYSMLSARQFGLGGTGPLNTFQINVASDDNFARIVGQNGLAVQPGKNKLFTGSVDNNETVSIPHTADYDLFAVKLGNSSETFDTVVLAYKVGNVINGTGGWAGDSDDYTQIYFFSATISGNTWTVQDAVVHNVPNAGGLQAATHLSLKEVVGVI